GEAAVAGEEGAEPERVDVTEGDARGAERLLGGVDQQVAGALVPVLAERRAPHAHDRHPIPDPVARHASPPWLRPARMVTGPVSIIKSRAQASRSTRIAPSGGIVRGSGSSTRSPRSLTMRAGVPTTVQSSGTSWLITKALAPIFAPSPMVTGPSTVAPVPMNT